LRRRSAAEAEPQASINDNNNAIASRIMARTPGGWALCHCPRAIALCKPVSGLSRASPKARGRRALAYLRVVPISLNTVLTCPPTNVTAVMMNTAIRLAINAYSIAVTPDSSLRKFRTRSMGFS
jgi:hypothetical protein